MENKPNKDSGDGSTVVLDIPATETNLFGSQAVHDVLSFVARYPAERFSITELADTVGYSQPSVSKAVDVLVANDLVRDRHEGNKRTVRINSDRLTRPNDPILDVPQSEFHPPVRTAVDELLDGLDDVVAIVLYGSVARGEADRRSDVDMWVLVGEDRMASQRVANRIRQDLEDRTFDSGRYEYEIDVEAAPAVPNYVEDVRAILSEGLVLHQREDFDTVQQFVFHGECDE